MNGVFVDSCVLLDLFTDDGNWADWSQSANDTRGCATAGRFPALPAKPSTGGASRRFFAIRRGSFEPLAGPCGPTRKAVWF